MPNRQMSHLTAGIGGNVYEVHDAAARAAIDTINSVVDQNSANIETLQFNKIGGAHVSDGYLYLTETADEDSDVIIGPLGPFNGTGGGGGGGGGGVFNYNVTLTDNSPSRSITAAVDQDVWVYFTYSSIDIDNLRDGVGSGSIYVSNVKVGTFQAVNGEQMQLNLRDYLSIGDNSIKIRVDNSEGSYRVLNYKITVATLTLTATNFEEINYYGKNDVVFGYRLVGNGNKTMHFILDGVETLVPNITDADATHTYTLDKPAVNTKAHLFQCFATLDAGGAEIKSSVLTYGIMWQMDGTIQTQVISTYTTETIEQGETINVTYKVYNSAYETMPVTFEIYDQNGTLYSSYTNETKNRDTALWSITDYVNAELGQPTENFTITLRIVCDGQEWIHQLNIIPYVLPISVAKGALLDFNPRGRSNDEPNKETIEGIPTTFSGFNWAASDGWLMDNKNNPILRFLPGSSAVMEFKPFVDEAMETGYTIELELSSRDVRDYDSIIIDCVEENGTIGLRVKSQEATLTSQQNSCSVQFKEDEQIHITFVIGAKSEALGGYGLVYIYIDGVMCGCQAISLTDAFQQANPANLTIGSETCGLDLYHIRCYKRALTRNEQLHNYICDRPSLMERRELYNDNLLLDSDNAISYNLETWTDRLPYLIMKLPVLPLDKNDKKKGCGAFFATPGDDSQNFVCTDAQIAVQGTSSAVYPTKNEKIKFSSSLYIGMTEDEVRNAAQGNFGASWTSAKKYPISPGSIEAKTLCIKVDFASSEGANNVELVDLYEWLVRSYKKGDNYTTLSLAQQEALDNISSPHDLKIRQGIEGKPIALFWNDGNQTTFLGKANMNNDKSNEDVFGFPGATVLEEQDTDDNGDPLVDEEGNPVYKETNKLNYTGATSNDSHYKDNLIEEVASPIECWEFLENSAELDLFKSDNFEHWDTAFEARYPDIEDEDLGIGAYGTTDFGRSAEDAAAQLAKLQAVVSWIYSTDSLQATNLPLATPVTFERGLQTTSTSTAYYNDLKNENGAYYSPLYIQVDDNFEARYSYDSVSGMYLDLTSTEENPKDPISEEVMRTFNSGAGNDQDERVNTDLYRYDESEQIYRPLYQPHTTTTTLDGERTFTTDSASYRLTKFYNEAKDHFQVDNLLLYYLFTEVFLMVDSRAKNMFFTTYDGQHWIPIPYDMDTAIGQR